jgi:Xaa-Pro aminopeptidase
MKEYQMHAIFAGNTFNYNTIIAYIRNHSNGLLGYMPICAAGKNCSVLHYTDNSKFKIK